MVDILKLAIKFRIERAKMLKNDHGEISVEKTSSRIFTTICEHVKIKSIMLFYHISKWVDHVMVITHCWVDKSPINNISINKCMHVDNNGNLSCGWLYLDSFAMNNDDLSTTRLSLGKTSQANEQKLQHSEISNASMAHNFNVTKKKCPLKVKKKSND